MIDISALGRIASHSARNDGRTCQRLILVTGKRSKSVRCSTARVHLRSSFRQLDGARRASLAYERVARRSERADHDGLHDGFADQIVTGPLDNEIGARPAAHILVCDEDLDRAERLESDRLAQMSLNELALRFDRSSSWVSRSSRCRV